MKETTVDNILAAGTELIFENGYNGVGLTKILEKAQIPKGSFYYYFSSKEDFGLKVIEFYNKQSVEFLKSFLEKEEIDPRQRIFDLFDTVQRLYLEQSYLKGCLLGNCSLELGGQKEAFAEKINDSFSEWQVLFERTIQEGQMKGSIKTAHSAATYADFLINSWEGALVRTKSTRNEQPMKLFIQFMEELL